MPNYRALKDLLNSFDRHVHVPNFKTIQLKRFMVGETVQVINSACEHYTLVGVIVEVFFEPSYPNPPTPYRVKFEEPCGYGRFSAQDLKSVNAMQKMKARCDKL